MSDNTYTTPTLEEVFKEINKRAANGQKVKHGPDYGDGTYTVVFDGEDDPEVVAVEPPAPKPAAPAAAKPSEAKPQRGPKPKAKAVTKEVETAIEA